jgi:hypothetical protein
MFDCLACLASLERGQAQRVASLWVVLSAGQGLSPQ